MKATEENLQILNDMNSMKPTAERLAMAEQMEKELGINQDFQWTESHDSCQASFDRVNKMIQDGNKNKQIDLEVCRDIIWEQMQSDLPDLEIAKNAMAQAWRVCG